MLKVYYFFEFSFSLWNFLKIDLWFQWKLFLRSWILMKKKILKNALDKYFYRYNFLSWNFLNSIWYFNVIISLWKFLNSIWKCKENTFFLVSVSFVIAIPMKNYSLCKSFTSICNSVVCKLCTRSKKFMFWKLATKYFTNRVSMFLYLCICFPRSHT
jgi:hypothetical protein